MVHKRRNKMDMAEDELVQAVRKYLKVSKEDGYTKVSMLRTIVEDVLSEEHEE